MKLTIAFLIGTLFYSALAFAGGISGGGGGTTNPSPSDPEQVAASVYHYGGNAVLGWLKGAEANYRRMSNEERLASAYRKLFDGEKTIYQILAATKVELRFNAPCLDSAGAPWDGSMYSSTPGAVCLSPFTMAPKLNDGNVGPETIALLIHEMSHLLGTNEDEAKEIQLHALWDLQSADLINLAVRPKLAAKALGEQIALLGMHITAPEFVQQRDMEDTLRTLVDLRRQIMFDYSLSFAMLRPDDLEDFTANMLRLEAVGDYACANDQREHEGIRQYCQERIEKAFGGADEVSGRTFIAQRDGIPAETFGPEYDRLTIARIRNLTGVKHALQGARAYWMKVQGVLNAHSAADIDIVRK
jgi:hypothetical protein